MSMLSVERRRFWARRMLVAQMIFAVGLFLFAFFALTTSLDSAFLDGVRQSFADGAGQPFYNSEALSALSAPLLLSVVVSAISLKALKGNDHRWGMAIYIALSLHVFGMIAEGGMAIFSLLTLLLLADRATAESLGLFKKA